jgi:hypothetical protein
MHYKHGRRQEICCCGRQWWQPPLSIFFAAKAEHDMESAGVSAVIFPNNDGWYSKLRAAVDWNLIEGGGAQWRKDLA